MTDLERLTAAFQAMDPWARGHLLDLARQYANKWPVPKPAPHLQLVHVERKELKSGSR